MTVPPIDRAEAGRFLSLLGKTPATARLRAFPHRHNPRKYDKKTQPNGIRARKGPYDLDTADCWQQEQRGVYLVINDGGDADSQITSCPAFWIEWDHRPVDWQLKAWREFGLGEPSLIVTTGGKSAHLYWILQSPITPEEWAPIQSALIEATGADSTNRNASRVMRLPGAYYIGPDGAATGQTRIHSTTDHRYTADDVAAWLTATPQATRQTTKPQQPRQGIPLHDNRGPLPLGDLPPRPPETLREALVNLPPFQHGAGQYSLLLGLALRLHAELGANEAQTLLAETCCQGIADLSSYFGERPQKISPGSIWPYLRDNWGTDISRHDLRGKAHGGAQQGQQAPPSDAPAAVAQEDEPPTYRELLASVLAAVEADDDDAEMAARAEIMARFRRTDGQIGAALFRLLTEQEQRRSGEKQQQRPSYRSIDLSKVIGIDWLLEGFIPANDQALLYAPAGAGKTTAALGIAFAVIDGTGFLDRDTIPTSGSVLMIAADSGPAPLIRTLQDLGRIDHPALSGSSETNALHVWAHDASQSAIGWDASLKGCIALLEFVRNNPIKLVIIDSCKAVTSRADVNYCDNQQVTALLTFVKEVICKYCSVLWLNHDGTGGNEAAGAKAWKEVPSAVHSIELVPLGEGEDGYEGQRGRRPRYSTNMRTWVVRKCRQGTAREFTYQINEDTGELTVTAATEIIRDARHGIGLLLWRAAQQGRQSLHRRDIFAELSQYSRGTVANSLTRASGGRRPMVARVASMPGHWRLTPVGRQWFEAEESEESPKDRNPP